MARLRSGIAFSTARSSHGRETPTARTRSGGCPGSIDRAPRTEGRSSSIAFGSRGHAGARVTRFARRLHLSVSAPLGVVRYPGRAWAGLRGTCLGSRCRRWRSVAERGEITCVCWGSLFPHPAAPLDHGSSRDLGGTRAGPTRVLGEAALFSEPRDTTVRAGFRDRTTRNASFRARGGDTYGARHRPRRLGERSRSCGNQCSPTQCLRRLTSRRSVIYLHG